MKNILPILLLIVSAALFYFYVIPRYDRVQTLSLERDIYNDILSKSAELREIRRLLKDKLVTLPPESLERLEKTIPGGGLDIPQLVLDLNSLAVKRGIIMRQISTSEIVETVRRGGVADTSRSYRILAIGFRFQAPYVNFISFLKDIETSARIMDVVSVEIQANGAEPLVQDYTLTIHTYWFRH